MKLHRKDLRIIKFYEKHGDETAKKAFGVDRKLISKWRKRLKENNGRLEALTPHSTGPKRARKSKISQEIINFIRSLRKDIRDLEKRRQNLF